MTGTRQVGVNTTCVTAEAGSESYCDSASCRCLSPLFPVKTLVTSHQENLRSRSLLSCSTGWLKWGLRASRAGKGARSQMHMVFKYELPQAGNVALTKETHVPPERPGMLLWVRIPLIEIKGQGISSHSQSSEQK